MRTSVWHNAGLSPPTTSTRCLLTRRLRYGLDTIRSPARSASINGTHLRDVASLATKWNKRSRHVCSLFRTRSQATERTFRIALVQHDIAHVALVRFVACPLLQSVITDLFASTLIEAARAQTPDVILPTAALQLLRPYGDQWRVTSTTANMRMRRHNYQQSRVRRSSGRLPCEPIPSHGRSTEQPFYGKRTGRIHDHSNIVFLKPLRMG